MDKEKFDAVLNYFSDQNIELPTEVKNAIEDVFSENDDVESVECYHRGDLDVFEKDIKLKNILRTSINGKTFGIINNVWTYYGDIKYSLSEDYGLEDNEGNIEEISKIEDEENSVINNPDDYDIVLIEKVEWDNEKDKTVHKTLTLYIYCPVDLEEDDEEEYLDPRDARYKELYNEIKNGEDAYEK